MAKTRIIKTKFTTQHCLHRTEIVYLPLSWQPIFVVPCYELSIKVVKIPFRAVLEVKLLNKVLSSLCLNRVLHFS